MDLPEHAPGLVVVIGAFPVPFKRVFFDVVPHHSLLASLPSDNSIPRLTSAPCTSPFNEPEVKLILRVGIHHASTELESLIIYHDVNLFAPFLRTIFGEL